MHRAAFPGQLNYVLAHVQNVKPEKLFSRERAVKQLLGLIDRTTLQDNGAYWVSCTWQSSTSTLANQFCHGCFPADRTCTRSNSGAAEMRTETHSTGSRVHLQAWDGTTIPW